MFSRLGGRVAESKHEGGLDVGLGCHQTIHGFDKLLHGFDHVSTRLDSV